MNIAKINPHITTNQPKIQELGRFLDIENKIKKCDCGKIAQLLNFNELFEVSCDCGKETDCYKDYSFDPFTIAKYKAIWDWNNDKFN